VRLDWLRQDGAVVAGSKSLRAQGELFDVPSSGTGAEPVLMALKPEFYDLIWAGLKTHEFRRRFVEDREIRWFVYLTAPVSRLAAVIDLGPAVVDAPERIAAIAEAARPGNGASVLEYVKDLGRAFAIPIRSVAEYHGIPVDELRRELGGFQPPQGFVRLARHHRLLAVCERLAETAPVRSMRVHAGS
jgi:predicted transcriptional regulator